MHAWIGVLCHNGASFVVVRGFKMNLMNIFTGKTHKSCLNYLLYIYIVCIMTAAERLLQKLHSCLCLDNKI